MTQNDLKQIRQIIKEETQRFPTKEDLTTELTNVKDDLLKRIDKVEDMQWAIFRTVEEIKADRSDVIRLEERIKKLEQKLAS